jgi:hypothetical protein
MHSGDPMLGLPQGLRIRPSGRPGLLGGLPPWSDLYNHKKVTLPPETSIMAHSYADFLAYLRDDPNIAKLTILIYTEMAWVGTTILSSSHGLALLPFFSFLSI